MILEALRPGSRGPGWEPDQHGPGMLKALNLRAAIQLSLDSFTANLA